MSERRVRFGSRGVYGRAMPLERPRRRGVKVPRPNLWQRRLVLIVIAVVAAGWGIMRLFAITEITVSASGHKAEINTATKKIVEGSLRQGNLLTLDSEELVSKLQQGDPLLRSVEVRRNWLHGITVSAILKQPSLGWSSGNQKYLLDRDGTVIGMLAAGSTIPVVVDGSNLPVQLGQRVVTTRFVNFVAGVTQALAAEGIGVSGLDVKDTTLDLNVSTNKGYRLIFDTSRPVADEIADLKAVRTLLATQHKTPGEYIDLRIAGKAYYR